MFSELKIEALFHNHQNFTLTWPQLLWWPSYYFEPWPHGFSFKKRKNSYYNKTQRTFCDEKYCKTWGNIWQLWEDLKHVKRNVGLAETGTKFSKGPNAFMYVYNTTLQFSNKNHTYYRAYSLTCMSCFISFYKSRLYLIAINC